MGKRKNNNRACKKFISSDVKAKPFSTDFQKQIKAAEELYGPQLQIEKCNRALEETLGKIEESHSKQIAMRIKLVCAIQENKYPNLYVNEITRHPEILQSNNDSVDISMKNNIFKLK